MERCASNLVVLTGIALALLGAPARATNWNWDCSADSGYQPCDGRFESASYTTDGRTMTSWVEGSGLILPPTGGSWTITADSNHALGRLIAQGTSYTLAGAGSFTLESGATIFQVDSAVKVGMTLIGPGGIEKTGSGILELAKTNTYSGLTAIRTGTLRILADGVLGDTVGETAVIAGGVLDLFGHSAGSEVVRLEGGRIHNHGSHEGDAFKKLRVASSSEIGGTANIVLKKGTQPAPYLSLDAGATLLKTDSNELGLDGMPVDNKGTIEVEAGALHSYGGTAFRGSGVVRIDSGAKWIVNPDTSGAVMENPLQLNGGALNIFGDSTSGAVEFQGSLTTSGGTNTVNTLSPAVFLGAVSGTGVLLKWGGAKLVLAADNPFDGSVRIPTGTLQIGAGGSTGSISADTIHDDMELVFDHASVEYFGGTIAGAGRLVKRGSGVLALTGRCPFAGETVVEAGKLVVTSTIGTDTAMVRSGAALGGTGTIEGFVEIASGALLDPGEYEKAGNLRVGSLVVASGGTLSFQVGKDSNRVIVGGNATLAGTIDLEAGTGIAPGTYVLATSTGTMTTTGLRLGSAPRGFTATLETTSKSVAVTLRIENAELFRDCGDSAGLQPCGGTWADTGFSADSVHRVAWPGVGNRAVFAGKDGSYRIAATGTVDVDSMVFRASGYRLTGDTIALAKGIRVDAGKIDTLDGVIVSGGRLVFDGGGTLVVRNSTAQAFGPLEIASGTFVVSRTAGDSVGDKVGTGDVTVAPGATLVLDSLVHADGYKNTLFLSGAGSGEGALLFRKNFYGASWNGNVVLNADATVGSRSLLRNTGRFTTLSGSITGSHALELRSYSGLLRSSGSIAVSGGLTVRGPDTVELSGSNTYLGNTSVATGTLRLVGARSIPHGAGKGDLVVDGRLEISKGDVVLNGLSGGGAVDIVSGDTLVLSVGDADRSSAFAGAFRNSTGLLRLSKIGTGTLTLSGSAVHGGGTRVVAGTLQVDGRCDSSAVVVGSDAILGGRGVLGAVVLDSGTLRPGTADSIGLLRAASVDASGGSGSTIAIRARGRTSPGVDHDRLTLSGALVLGDGSALDLDLQGLAASDTGTIAGIVQAASVSGAFATVNVLHAGRHSVTLRYGSDAIDAIVGIVPYVVSLDTLLKPAKDSVGLTIGNGIVLLVPPHDSIRRVLVAVDDSVLGRGIAGADTAVVVQPGSTADGPLVVRVPLEVVPDSRRLPGEIPSAFRIDSAGRVQVVETILRADSTLEYVATGDGATWLGYDTVPPAIVATWSRDSLGPADTAVVGFRLQDNVAGTTASSCLLQAGGAAAVCSARGVGDSIHGEFKLSRSDLPLGAMGWFEAKDTRAVARTPTVDLVSAIDTLRAASLRLEDRYELVSFPCLERGRSAHALFRDVWGGDDSRHWRAFRYDSAGFSEILDGDTTPGCARAFWVRTRGVELRSRVVDGWSLPVSVPVALALVPGWNMVGNPYGFEVDWDRVRASSGLDTLDVQGPYLYDGAEGNWSLPDSTPALPSWRGAAIRNSTGRAVTLRLPATPGSSSSARRMAATALVRVALRASQDTRRSSWMRLGVERGGASRALPVPPAPTGAVGAFLEGDGSASSRQLLSQMRTERDTAREWTLRVDGLAPGTPLRLETARGGSDTAAAAWIFDEKASRWLALAANMDFAVGDETARRFRIALRPTAPVGAPVERLALVARGSRIRWSIPDDMGRVRVRIELRDLSGRLSSVLVDEAMDPGSYERTVPGSSGAAACIVVLRAGGRIETARSARLR